MSASEPGPLDRLFERLAHVTAAADPVPQNVQAAARAAFAWRTAGAELAQLVYDSAGPERALAGVRGGEGPRQLTFAGPRLTIEVEVAPSGGRLLGQLVPPQPAWVEVRTPVNTVEVLADELGRFVVDGVRRGPVSLRLPGRPHDGSNATTTDWVLI